MSTARNSEGAAGESPPSRTSVSPPGPNKALVAAGSALVAAVLALALFGHYQRTVALERTATAREASTVIGAVEAGINVHVRPGAQYLEGRLQSYLDSLIETSPALTIALIGEDHDPFMAAGEADLVTEDAHFAEAHVDSVWRPRDGRARFQRRIQATGGAGRGGGRGPRGRDHWSAFPSGPLTVAVVMDAADLTERIAAAQRRLGFSLAGLLGVSLLAGFTFSLYSRRRRLEAELGRAEERAAQHERMTRLGAGLAHETRNPLGVVRGLLQTIASDQSANETARESARDAIDEVDRTVGRINSFLQLARPVDPEPAPVEVSPLLDDVTRLLSTEAPSGAKLVPFCGDEDLVVSADPDMLRRTLFNLGLNALRAVEPEGTVRFEAWAEPNETVELRVVDDGRGIAPEDLPRVTEPYFTRSQDGSGLGLSIVERIAGAHGWTLSVESEPKIGTRVLLRGLARLR